MQLNIFSTPVFINNIDSSRIILNIKKMEPTWNSETISNYCDKDYFIEENNLNYLYSVIGESLSDFIKTNFKIKLLNIWQNNYINNDFQEKHIHSNSDFSFVIYKEVNESKTVFFSPDYYLINSFYENKYLNKYFNTTFIPKLKKDQIIIFPGYLEHMVKKSSNSITISGNIKIESHE
jgi:hypothetical protein